MRVIAMLLVVAAVSGGPAVANEAAPGADHFQNSASHMQNSPKPPAR